jgi:hypothetical protein
VLQQKNSLVKLYLCKIDFFFFGEQGLGTEASSSGLVTPRSLSGCLSPVGSLHLSTHQEDIEDNPF